jgi:hypothetical protein
MLAPAHWQLPHATELINTIAAIPPRHRAPVVSTSPVPITMDHLENVNFREPRVACNRIPARVDLWQHPQCRPNARAFRTATTSREAGRGTYTGVSSAPTPLPEGGCATRSVVVTVGRALPVRADGESAALDADAALRRPCVVQAADVTTRFQAFGARRPGPDVPARVVNGISRKLVLPNQMPTYPGRCCAIERRRGVTGTRAVS